MGRNGTTASLLVEDLRAVFERARTEQQNLAANYARRTNQLVRELQEEVMKIAVGYFHSAATLQGFEHALLEFTTPESRHFEDTEWLEAQIGRLLPSGSDVEPFLIEVRDSQGSILARLRAKVFSRRRFF